jgi:hypothetical protein
MSERMRFLAGVAGSALALSLTGCGGGSDSPTAAPTPVATPVPCTQTSAYQDAAGVPARTLLYDDFSVPESGRLDVTMDWTNASSTMGFYLVPVNSCTLDEFNARSCNFLIRSETNVKPRKVSLANFTAGNYRWIIGNFSTSDEAASLQIVLSKGSCAALAAPATASGHAGDAMPPFERAQPR